MSATALDSLLTCSDPAKVTGSEDVKGTVPIPVSDR
jgi:hypothetical protein